MMRLLTGLLIFISCGAQAASVTYSQPRLALQRCNVATVKAFVFFDVSKASLYRQSCQHSPLAISAPLMLTFHYTRDVPAKAFRKSSRHFIKKNLDASLYQQLAARISAFNAGYKDTHAGDTYRLEYRRDQRFLLYFNGHLIARENGKLFAQAYLSIWFGDKPFSDALKAALLTGKPQ